MRLLVLALLVATCAAEYIEGGAIDPSSMSTILGSVTPAEPYSLGFGMDGSWKNIHLSQPSIESVHVPVSFPRGTRLFSVTCPSLNVLFSNRTGWVAQPAVFPTSETCSNSFFPTTIRKVFNSSNTETDQTNQCDVSLNGLTIACVSQTELSIYQKQTACDSSWIQIYETSFDDSATLYRATIAADAALVAVSRVNAFDPQANTNNTVYIFAKTTNGTYISFQNITGGSRSEFGTAVELISSGGVLYVGAPGVVSDNNTHVLSGLVYVYTWVNSSVGFQYLNTMAPPDNKVMKFGSSLASSVDAGRLVVGAPGARNNIGAVFVVKFNWTDFKQTQILPIFLPPENLDGCMLFGASVATSKTGSVIAIGAPGAACDGLANPSGALMIYEDSPDSSTMKLLRIYCLSGNQVDDPPRRMGESVACSNDCATIAVGVPGLVNGGAVAVYTRLKTTPGTLYTVQSIIYNDRGNETTAMGQSLSLSYDGSLAVVGSDRKMFVLS